MTSNLQLIRRGKVEAEDSSDQNANWFRRHVLEKLTDLAKGQAEILASQKYAQEANVKHAADDAAAFAQIRQEIEALKPIKTMVYSFVGMVLVAVIGSLIALVVGHKP